MRHDEVRERLSTTASQVSNLEDQLKSNSIRDYTVEYHPITGSTISFPSGTANVQQGSRIYFRRSETESSAKTNTLYWFGDEGYVANWSIQPHTSGNAQSYYSAQVIKYIDVSSIFGTTLRNYATSLIGSKLVSSPIGIESDTNMSLHAVLGDVEIENAIGQLCWYANPLYMGYWISLDEEGYITACRLQDTTSNLCVRIPDISASSGSSVSWDQQNISIDLYPAQRTTTGDYGVFSVRPVGGVQILTDEL